MFPSRKQWLSWSLPSKLTLVGTYVGILGVILSVVFFLYSPAQTNDTTPSNISKQKSNGKKVVINGLLDNDKLLDEIILIYPNELGLSPGLYLKLSASQEDGLLLRGSGVSWAGLSWNEKISMYMDNSSKLLFIDSKSTVDSLEKRKLVTVSVRDNHLVYVENYKLWYENQLICNIDFSTGKAVKNHMEFEVITDQPLFVWDDKYIPNDCK